MSQYGYQIVGYSATMNEAIQELDLEDDKPIEDASWAQRRADNWALRLNSEQRMGTQDWVGQIREITHPGSFGIKDLKIFSIGG